MAQQQQEPKYTAAQIQEQISRMESRYDNLFCDKDLKEQYDYLHQLLREATT